MSLPGILSPGIAIGRYRRQLRAVAAALAALALAGAASPTPQGLPDLAALLDEYAAGGSDGAIRRVQQIEDDAAIEMRLDWATVGRSWIERDPADRPRRLFAAAAFALETEAIRVERGQWSRSASRKVKENGKEKIVHCNGACVLSWARGLFVERGVPDAVEHAWWMASIALAQGVRETGFGFLLPPVPLSPAFAAAARLNQIPANTTAGHLDAALIRFPNDPEFRLAHAVAQGARYEITTDAAPRSPAAGGGSSDLGQASITVRNISRGSGPQLLMPVGPTSAQINRDRYAQLPLIVSKLEAIAGDPAAGVTVRTEARIRLGYIQWATGDSERALASLHAAVESAPAADLLYLSHYLTGVALDSLTDTDGAIRAYERALAARPHSQSASLRLAVLRRLQGDATGAQALAQDSLEARPADADPWRVFLYGHYADFPALMAAVRRQVPR